MVLSGFTWLLLLISGDPVRVIGSREEQLRIVHACHEGLGKSLQSKALSGHLGRDKTQARIRERFYWPTITKDVQDFVKACDTCQQVNSSFQKTRGELQSIPVNPDPFHQIGIDLIGPLPTTKEGYKYIVTAIDYYTKWTEAQPHKDKSACSVADFIYKIICRHGCFNIEISDQGREFVSTLSQNLHTLTGVNHRISTAYHPQTNGLVEKQNQTTQNIFLKYLQDKKEWADILDSVMFAYRTSKHATTGFSPFFLLYGRKPRLPVDLMVEENTKNEQGEMKIETSDFSMEEIIQSMENLRKAASVKADANIKKAQAHQQKCYNNRNSPDDFEVGDEVLLKEMKNSSRSGGKLEDRFVGPYVIFDVVRKGVFRLTNGKTPLKKTVNVSRLKRYFRPEAEKTRDELKPPGVDCASTNKPAERPPESADIMVEESPLEPTEIKMVGESPLEPTDIKMVEESPLEHTDINMVEESPLKPTDIKMVEESPLEPTDIKMVEESPLEPTDIKMVEESPLKPTDIKMVEESPLKPTDIKMVEESPLEPTDIKMVEERPLEPTDIKMVEESPLEPTDIKTVEESPLEPTDIKTGERAKNDCYITKETKTQFAPTNKNPRFRPFNEVDLKKVTKPRYWLSDLEVNGAQALLNQQYPACEGLEDTCLSHQSQFSVQGGEFLQISNVNHWVLFSTIGCVPGKVKVFDCLYRHLHVETCSAIAGLLCSPLEEIQVEMPPEHRDRQTGRIVDCSPLLLTPASCMEKTHAKRLMIFSNWDHI